MLESTIWHDFSHIGGFVASYLEDGLACPLLLQIADEIRGAFPELLEKHPLSQAWAFKGLQAKAAIDAHADDAAVSINFWVTPDHANLNPDGGGLVVCRAPPPAAWQVQGLRCGHGSDLRHSWTGTPPTAWSCLTARTARSCSNPGCFTAPDATEFATGYENHRINLTLLFGRHTD